MQTALEISSQQLRYAQIHAGRLTAMGSIPLNPDIDIFEALAAAPLPSPLGRTRVLMHHQDMLQQVMIQPPCPEEKLDRIVRFELMGLVPDAQAVLAEWHIAPIGGDGDMRILVNIAKRNLIEGLSKSLAAHQGQLQGLSVPASGLYDGWRSMQESTNADDESADAILVDVGGLNTHVALVRGQDLLFLRTHRGGMDDIINGVSHLRSMEREEATRLVARLGAGAPDDIRDMIKNAVSGISAGITAVLRFASAQLKTPAFKPGTLFLSGAGGQLPGFIEALQERSGMKVRIINPFIGLAPTVDPQALDYLSALPSSYANVLGAARSPTMTLDVVEQLRQERYVYWSTHGVLRAAVLIAVTLMALALVRQWWASQTAQGVQQRLAAGEEGLVPRASANEQRLRSIIEEKEADRQRVDFLRRQLAPGKVLIELLGAVAQVIDPQRQRIQLRSFQMYPSPDGLRVVLEGIAEVSGQRSLGEILESFRQDLLETYPLIANISDLGSSIDANRMHFSWELQVRDQHQADSEQRPAPTSPAAEQGRSRSTGRRGG